MTRFRKPALRRVASGDAFGDFDAGGAEHGVAFAGDAGVGVGEGGDGAGEFGGDQRRSAGGRVAMVGAGFQGDIGGGALRGVPGLFQRADLGMGAAAGLGPAATDHDPAPDEDTADGGIGPDIAKAPRGEAQGMGHVVGVGHSSPAAPGRSSETKPSKSSAVWKFL